MIGTKMSQKSQKDAALAVVIICVLIYAYGPLARAQYAYGDDYWLLLSDEESGAAYLSDGRPIFALAHSLIHRPIEAIGRLGYMRLITSFWVGILSAFFFGLVRRWGAGASNVWDLLSRSEHCPVCIPMLRRPTSGWHLLQVRSQCGRPF